MVHSDIHKYLIRHEKEPESAMKEFPVSINMPLKTQRNIVSLYAYRNIHGTMVQKLVADIPKLHMDFKGISLTNALTISRDMIGNKILQYGTKDFWINAYTIQYGWISGLFTLGTPDISELLVDLSNDLSSGVVDLSFEWQAVEGFKLNRKV